MAGFTLAVLRGLLHRLVSSVYISPTEHERFVLGRNETLPVAAAGRWVAGGTDRIGAFLRITLSIGALSKLCFSI